jgi:hypothetical protein
MHSLLLHGPGTQEENGVTVCHKQQLINRLLGIHHLAWSFRLVISTYVDYCGTREQRNAIQGVLHGNQRWCITGTNILVGLAITYGKRIYAMLNKVLQLYNFPTVLH